MSQQNRQDSKMSNFNTGKKEDSISNTMCVIEINSTVLDFWLRQKSKNLTSLNNVKILSINF